MYKKILIAIVVILVVIQFIPVDITNPPVTEEIKAPENVMNILHTSCYDCHSNKTNWPWYSYVAPVSFFISSDVSEGRHHLNFTEWNKYDEKRREKKLDGVEEMVEEGDMPLATYKLMHPSARLDENKVNVIKEWVKSKEKKDDSLENEAGGHKY